MSDTAAFWLCFVYELIQLSGTSAVSLIGDIFSISQLSCIFGCLLDESLCEMATDSPHLLLLDISD